MLDRIEDTMGALVEDKLQRKFRAEFLSIHTLEGAFRVFHDYEGALRSFPSQEILALCTQPARMLCTSGLLMLKSPINGKDGICFESPRRWTLFDKLCKREKHGTRELTILPRKSWSWMPKRKLYGRSKNIWRIRLMIHFLKQKVNLVYLWFWLARQSRPTTNMRNLLKNLWGQMGTAGATYRWVST